MKISVLSLPGILILSLAAALCARGASDYTTPYVFTTLAGTSSIGSADGAGSAARFYSPQDAATDATGNIFIVDEGNHTIRKITPAGVVTTIAGTAGIPGNTDGTGAAARFDSPQGIVADGADNLYVTDTGNHTIRKITPAGVVTTFAGLAGVTGSANGTGGSARFSRPRKLAIDSTGNLYVTEAGNNDVRKITPAGVVTTFADNLGFPEAADIGAAVPVFYGSIAADSSGNVYVSCFLTKDPHTHGPTVGDYYEIYIGYVYKIAPDGTRTWLWQTSAYHYFDGRTAGTGGSALTIDPSGQLIAGQDFRIYRYAPASSSLLPLAGDGLIGGSDGPALSAKFGFPLALAYDRTGTLHIADAGNNVVRKLTTAGSVTTVAGISLESATTTLDGTGAAARFATPTATAVDANGNVYVADASAHCIRKITPAGVVTTLAGAPGQSGSDDGTGTAARFAGPRGLAVDAAGNVFVADTNNHTVRRITATGDTTTFAGVATATGWYDGQGTEARFSFPRGIALDATGNVFVTSASTVRKIDAARNVTTLAGLNNESGYVDATAGGDARFTAPCGITVDAGGNVYVTEAPDSPAVARIRKITPTGSVTTLAGAEHGYADGSGTAARFHDPYGIAADRAGNLYVADTYNQTVRKITAEGAVSTLAGLVDSPGSTDGAGRDARFFYPQGVASDATGQLYVTSGTTVRKGLLATLSIISAQPQSLTVVAGNSASFSITATGLPAPTFQWQRNGSALSGATGNTLLLSNVQSADAGDYTVVVTNALGSVTSNKATLTVTTAPTPPPPAPTSGGGGAIASWFVFALMAGGATRAFRPSRR